MSQLMFKNRREAGRKLAERLRGHAGSETLVVGLPRGGVVVAAEVARELDLPLDVIVARKIGAPGHAEFGIGAVAPNGVRYVDWGSVRSLHISDEQLEDLTEAARQEAHRRMGEYAGGRGMPGLEGRKVIVVDDGLATGSTAHAAVEAAREAGAREIVLAVPVGAAESVAALEGLVEEVVCLSTPTPFQAVGLWYEVFDQTSSEEVKELLREYGLPERNVG